MSKFMDQENFSIVVLDYVIAYTSITTVYKLLIAIIC